MAAPVSLMEFVQLLAGDAGMRSHFAADPAATLSKFGLDDLTPADVQDAVVLVEDNRTVDYVTAFGSGAGADAGWDFGSGGSAPDGPDGPDGPNVDVDRYPDGSGTAPDGPPEPDADAHPEPDPDPDLDPDLDAVLDDGADLHLG